MKADSPFNLLSPADMAKVADDACCYKANKHIPTTYLSAFTAGMFISIAFVFLYYCYYRYRICSFWAG
ncbi:formate transporter FocA [Proteus penneri ATCC 35198]|nr:formate transporter FocA [Proteus penneri ATCC 35198]